MKQILKTILIILIISTCNFAQPDEDVIAFPGAEGYGRFATGGRGGKIVLVTNLNDSGPGSLRKAVKMKEPRIILFKVSGNIELKSPLEIKHGNLTIAGQSAPGDGICLQNYPLEIKHADNVVIRYIRSRLGDLKKQEEDAISVRFCKNIIIDHCSFSWGVDECASFYTNEDFTLQWSIISESLNDSYHHKGEHGYGGIWGGVRASFHHNLIAHNKSRNPRFSGESGDGDIPSKNVDFRNNVIYNWRNNSAYGGELGEHNIINNYYKPGPATKRKEKARIVNPYKPYGKFYVKGNIVEGNEKISKDNLAGGVQCANPDEAVSEIKFVSAMVETSPANIAFEQVINYAGASFKRDSVDDRVCMDVKNGEATFKGSKNKMPGIIDSQSDVGGWPVLRSVDYPKDSDNDGMPDEWELKHGLNTDNPDDALKNSIDKNYNNIEVYVNSLIAK